MVAVLAEAVSVEGPPNNEPGHSETTLILTDSPNVQTATHLSSA